MITRRIHLSDDQVALAFERKMSLYLDHRKDSDPNPNDPLVHVKRHLSELSMSCNDVIKLSREASKAMEEFALLEKANKEAGKSKAVKPPEELTCPVCICVFESKIFLCKNGHSVCMSCSQKLKSCPECRAAYKGKEAKIRNLALEKLAENYRRDTERKQQEPEVRENTDALVKSKQDSIVRIAEKLEAANERAEKTHQNWMISNLLERQRIAEARGGKASTEAMRQLMWISKCQQTKFWEVVVGASKKT